MTSAVTVPRARVTIGRRLLAALATAVVLSAAVHLASLTGFAFINALGSAEIVGQVNDFFLPALGVLFVLTFIFAAVKAYAFWHTALAAGIVTGVLSTMVGYEINAAAADTTVALGEMLSTLIGINLPYLIASIVLSVTLARVVWRRAANGRRRPARAASRRVALVRVPSSNLEEGEVTHIERTEVDAELADAQWDNYVTALLDSGWSTVEVDPAPEHPDSVFIEDVVVIVDGLAVITSPGAETRRGEIEGAEKAVRDLGLPIERISLPGTLDGGDVLKVGTTIYVGRGGRTNADGIRQFRSIVAGRGYSVVAVPTTKVLHLKSAVTALPDGTIIGYPPLVDDSSVFDRFLAVPEESGAHVVVLKDDTVLMAASAPKSQELIADLGYRVVSVDISEFEKMEGCVTCLSVRVR